MKKILFITILFIMLSACTTSTSSRQLQEQTPTSPPSTKTPTTKPTVTPTPSFSTRVEGLQEVINGDSFPETAEYHQDIMTPHPLIILNYSGEYHDWNQDLPQTWKANAINEIELVVIIGGDIEVSLDTQAYTPGPSITRYRHDLNVYVYETHSGELVNEGIIQGPEPDPFPDTAPMEKTRIDGGPVDLVQLKIWLNKVIYSYSLGQGDGFTTDVEFSPNAETIASGYEDGFIRFYNLKDQSLMTSIDTQGYVIEVTYSPDGKTLASIHWGQSDILLWNVSDGTLNDTLSGVISPGHITFSTNGEMLACSSEKNIYIWAIKNKSISTIITGHTDGISSIAFSPNGELVASVSYDGTLKLWQTDNGALINSTKIPQVPYNSVSDVVFSQNGETIIASLWDTYLILDSNDGTVINSFVFDDPHDKQGIALSPNGNIWASLSTGEEFQLWNMEDFSLLTTLDDQMDFWITSADFSSEGNFIASESGEDAIRVWCLDLILNE